MTVGIAPRWGLLIAYVYLRPVSPFPVTYYKGTVEVFSSYDGLGIVVWTIEFDSKPEDAVAVAELVHEAISAGLDGMEKDLHLL